MSSLQIPVGWDCMRMRNMIANQKVKQHSSFLLTCLDRVTNCCFFNRTRCVLSETRPASRS